MATTRDGHRRRIVAQTPPALVAETADHAGTVAQQPMRSSCEQGPRVAWWVISTWLFSHKGNTIVELRRRECLGMFLCSTTRDFGDLLIRHLEVRGVD
jgi:hypothetical protein